MKIRCCGNNEWALDLAKRLEGEFPRLGITVDDCLKKCGPCREKPFVLVDGELISAHDAEDLYHQVQKRLANHRQ
jgi:uncharacterized protein YuzB (UPF0349 family)